ncbi:phospholipid-transporting ATPase Dnf1p [Trichomonascus vanleenenianus]|uniref:phospholipid-transporting ATPase Dnf1p n=1 Tax=Trichomonascus vanleenenianus TaxID=2268995 RepID=UPI003ECB2187
MPYSNDSTSPREERAASNQLRSPIDNASEDYDNSSRNTSRVASPTSPTFGDTRRFSSNNPFNPLPPPPRKRSTPPKTEIRPVSDVPVDDAFDYSGYDFDEANQHQQPKKKLDRNSIIQTPIIQTIEHFEDDHAPTAHGHNSSMVSSPSGSNALYTRSRKSYNLGTASPSLLSPTTPTRHISFAQSITESPKSISHSLSSGSINLSQNSHLSSTRQGQQQQEDLEQFENSTMKRHRWGTQRHKKGRPPPGPKRSKTIFRRRTSMMSHKSSIHEPSEEVAEADNINATRRIFINTPLPKDMIDPETGLPIAEYPRNKIRTTKYTPLSFIPKNLYYQFQNVANIYFLFIVILGAFPIFGVQSAGLAAVPIIVIVVITAFKDAVEDYRRTLLDLEVNNTPTQILAHSYNYNVTDENVSLWRRFKKANTRLMMRIGRSIKKQQHKKKVKQQQKRGIPMDEIPPFENQLTRSTTIHSIYSVNEDDYTFSSETTVYDDSTSKQLQNPFEPTKADSTSSNASTVVDRNQQTPGTAKFRRDFWKSVRVGDFVRIKNNDEIPADVVILATSDSDGACYVETKNLDGETNLKVRQALKCGAGIKHSLDCEKAKFWIESEAPHANLYAYNGVAKWYSDGEGSDEKSEPISINNILLRGCSLRNTDWVIGVVLFTGQETKIMMNAGVTPTKRSQISRELNLSVISNFALLFILCFASGLINGIVFGEAKTSIDYFEFGSIGGTPALNGLVTFWAAVILYQSLVPISLYISIEIVKTIQAFFIYSDCFMYYAPIDYPCTPKSWNISDDLGQIEYIFSDKTGTLTQNVMEFKKCTINGVAYGKAYTEALAGLRKREGVDVEAEGEQMRREIKKDKAAMIRELRSINDNPQMVDEDVTFVSSQYAGDIQGLSGRDQEIACKHFMLALALCHSVIVEPSKKHPGRMEFKAQSPDEAALVATARDMGFTFVERTQKGVVINVQGIDREFQILNTLEFNSTRKRMSAIVKFKAEGTDTEKIYLICKGADSIIYSRLKVGEQEELRKETALHLEQFAQEGLRTLCIAQRELTAEQYHSWNQQHEVAAAAITNREEKMEEVADSIERELTLLGGTAIEDRLQEGVPQAISLLGDAGIKLWVLTGDKVETAINIGFSCNLLDNGMELLVLRVEDGSKASTERLISEYLHKYFNMTGSDEELDFARQDHSPPSPQYAVIIDGDTLKLALDDNIKTKLLLLCKQCRAVLCCRVSPAQKAAVVRLVKTTLGVMTLSIGDGANDVSMIQEADVGVGIAGEEGRQAVMSSDYAIGQFRFLTRLLLVHGRWSYRRLAEMIPNFFYKNVVFTLALFWYGISSSFDGAYLFEYTYVMFFNLAFTSLPVIAMGVLDQDVDDRLSLAVPQLYRRGILRLEWTQKKFWIYMFDGAYQSFVSFFFPYFLYWHGSFQHPEGLPINHRFWMGLAVCSIAVISCNVYVLSNQYRWDWISVLIGSVSILLVYFWSGIYSATVYSGELYQAASEMFGSCVYWAVVVLGVVACLLPHYAWMAIQRLWLPEDIDIIREQIHIGEFDHIPPVSENGDVEKAGPSVKTKESSFEDELQLFDMRETSYQESTYDGDSMYGTKPVGKEYIPPMPTVGAVNDSSTRQKKQHRQSLDEMRHSLRMEQLPSRQSLEGVRTSMEMREWPTAEVLMRASLEGPRPANHQQY